MVMTQTSLLFVGSLATLATLGLFYRFDDRWTGVLVGFTAATLWAIFGLSSFEITFVAEAVVHKYAMMPLVLVGVGMAFITALFAASDLFTSAGAEASETTAEDIMGGR